MYERMMTRWRSAVRAGHRDRSARSEVRTVAAAILAVGGDSIILFSIFAEFLSLKALYSAKASIGTQRTVLQASVALLIMTALGPAYAFTVTYFGTLVDDYRAARERRAKRLSAENTKNERAAEWMKQKKAEWLKHQAPQEGEQSAPEETEATGTGRD
jgi:hypothetical protein